MKETKKQKKLPTCPYCRKGFFDCLIVDDEKGVGYHLECLEIKKSKSIMKNQKFLEPIHPGDTLKTEFLEVNNLTIEEIAQNTELDKGTLEKLIRGEIPINFKIASELGSYFKLGTQFWINLQEIYWEQMNKWHFR